MSMCPLKASSSSQASKTPRTSSVHRSQLDPAEHAPSSSVRPCQAELPGPRPRPRPGPAEQLSHSAPPAPTPPLALETVSPAGLPQSPSSPSLRPPEPVLSSQSPASTSSLPGRLLRGTRNPQAERKNEEDHLESGKWIQGEKTGAGCGMQDTDRVDLRTGASLPSY